ncbi:DWNN domain-containing protein [Hygrophoropsis aurantiaca]|uniref:DWNN domain-containing protein n=1 Tax=Hygrophoropsis aurantiaca TaxID=72124 RepID=A0ACB8AP23_9AGAM|nr:DWNN domain-containing protein [Hygrophoropsis aurantiaca]
MASSVFYKFKSQRDESRVTFDGTGISIFDLKKEIILANNLGKANDFDLFVYDSSTQQEYKDDSHIVPRSSSVIVKRLPSSRPGKGKAAMYIAGTNGAAPVPTSEPVQRSGGNTWHKGAMSKRFDGKEEQASSSIPHASTKPDTSTIPKSSITKDDEAAAMAAMFQAQTANWEDTQEKMSHAVRIYNNPRGTSFGGRGGKPHTPHQQPHHQERPLPPSYVCYRCGQKGHWIQDCPTNNDREFDNKPRIKRTTGIPRSFLKAVENPNKGEMTQGVMVTPEGGYVVAQPDSASWQKKVTRPKGLTAADVRERAPSDPSLACPIDNRLFRDVVKTPCCGTSYCEECIQTHLLERDFTCPKCGKKIASLDKVVIDKPTRTKVADYIDKTIEESRKAAEDEGAASGSGTGQTAAGDGLANDDFYSDQQPGLDMSQMIVDSIPQLQAQIAQLSQMMQNPTLPNPVRQTTEIKYQQLQLQLQQAQALAATLAVANTLQQQQQQQQQQMQNTVNAMQYNMQGYQQKNDYQPWTNNFSNQQPAGQDSAYQRLPVNNRRRNLKRDRPSDFLEVGGESKVPRYWE